MAQPTTYTWDSSLTEIAPLQAVSVGVPMTLTNTIPSGQARAITFVASVANSEVTATLVGLDEYSQLITKAITVKNTGTTDENSYGFFTEIYSVTPTFITGTDVKLSLVLGSTGEGLGFTKPYLCDVWNQNPQYSYSLSIKALPNVGSIKVQRFFEPNPAFDGSQNKLVYPTSSNKWEDIPSQPILVAGKTISGALSDFPMTAIRFYVTDTTLKAKFTATIMQQGGFF